MALDPPALENATTGRTGNLLMNPTESSPPAGLGKMQAKPAPAAPGSQSADALTRPYQFVDLSSYSFWDRIMIRAAGLFFYLTIYLVGFTARYEVEGWHYYEELEHQKIPSIHVLWHDCIYLAVYFWRNRKITYMASQSFDGEYITRFLQRFGFGAVRGSSTRGGAGAVLAMAKLLHAGISVGFTLDGPKGPRRVAKMGAVMLAKKTGQPILAFNVAAQRRWLAPSWDSLQLPIFFTRARVELARPLYVPANADAETLRLKLAELQETMDQLAWRGEQWRASL
jgi:lysophospholipid acyltransferase (LPLAT)-like uncharacterized protein